MGSVSAGRPHVELQQTIGMFANTFAVRSRPEGTKQYREYLMELKAEVLDAFDQQDYPFEELVRELGIRRDVSRNPLFDAMFVLENMFFGELSLEELRVVPCRMERRYSKFDLSLIAEEVLNGMVFRIEYATKL